MVEHWYSEAGKFWIFLVKLPRRWDFWKLSCVQARPCNIMWSSSKFHINTSYLLLCLLICQSVHIFMLHWAHWMKAKLVGLIWEEGEKYLVFATCNRCDHHSRSSWDQMTINVDHHLIQWWSSSRWMWSFDDRCPSRVLSDNYSSQRSEINLRMKANKTFQCSIKWPFRSNMQLPSKVIMCGWLVGPNNEPVEWRSVEWGINRMGTSWQDPMSFDVLKLWASSFITIITSMIIVIMIIINTIKETLYRGPAVGVWIVDESVWFCRQPACQYWFG